MSDRRALLAAILAAPDDDAPRLIYADWLEENGQSERAEFIRVQCELARLLCDDWDNPLRRGVRCYCRACLKTDAIRRRERELLEAHRGDWRIWCQPKPNSGSFLVTPGVEFRRGFVHSLACTAADWLTHADAILAEHPVREVRLTTLSGEHDWQGLEEAIVAAGHARRWFHPRWTGITFHLPERRAFMTINGGEPIPIRGWSMRSIPESHSTSPVPPPRS